MINTLEYHINKLREVKTQDDFAPLMINAFNHIEDQEDKEQYLHKVVDVIFHRGIDSQKEYIKRLELIANLQTSMANDFDYGA